MKALLEVSKQSDVCVVLADLGIRKRTMVTDFVGRGVCLSLLYNDHMDFHRGSYWGETGWNNAGNN